MRAFVAMVLLAAAVLCGQVAPSPAADKAQDGKRQPVATVLGKTICLDEITPAEAPVKEKELSPDAYQRWLHAYRTDLLHGKIWAEVMHDYAVRERLYLSFEDLDAILARGLPNQPSAKDIVRDLSREDKNTGRDARQQLGERFSLYGAANDWKVAKALYERYGGRVAISQFGACTAIDGRNAVLKDYAAAKKIVFHNADWQQAFWDKNADNHVLLVTLPPGEVANYFKVPPWEEWIGKKAASKDGRKDAAK